MTDAWDERKRAKEEQFFERQNEQAMSRLRNKQKEGARRLSPITGEAMEQVNIHGVIVDRCPTSGYIGLDAGELEQILTTAQESDDEGGWFSSLFEGLISKRK